MSNDARSYWEEIHHPLRKEINPPSDPCGFVGKFKQGRPRMGDLDSTEKERMCPIVS